MTLKNASLGLKITRPLKEKITDIARSNKKSVNEWVTDVLTAHIEKCEFSSVDNFKLPDAKNAKHQSINRQSDLFDETIILVKTLVKEMIEKGEFHFFITIPTPITQNVEEYLNNLKYRHHQFKYDVPDKNIKKGDFIFCTDDEVLKSYKKLDSPSVYDIVKKMR